MIPLDSNSLYVLRMLKSIQHFGVSHWKNFRCSLTSLCLYREMYYRLSLHGFILDGACVCILRIAFSFRGCCSWNEVGYNGRHAFCFSEECQGDSSDTFWNQCLRTCFPLGRTFCPFWPFSGGECWTLGGKVGGMTIVVVGLSNQRESKGTLGPTWAWFGG